MEPIPEWGQWIVGLAAVLTASGYLVKKIALPLARVASRTEQSLPVLQQIAKEFANNGGSTLKDKVNQACENALRAREAAERAEKLIIRHLEKHGRD